MPESPFSTKKFISQSDDPRIEVLHRSDIIKGRVPYSFKASTIHHLEDLGESRSAIVLQSGTAIELSIPYTDLVEKIEGGQSPVDLKAYCILQLEVGMKMDDGSIYVGKSPSTGEAMYTTPKDTSMLMNFNTAAAYTKELRAHGHNDWRLPTVEELKVLIKNKNTGALKGTFSGENEDAAQLDGWYLSSTHTQFGYGKIQVVHSSDESGGGSDQDVHTFRCRPVRTCAGPI